MSEHPHHTNPDPTPDEIRSYAAAARARKKAAAEAIGIDASYVSRLVELFYGKIRQDALLGPIFATRIEDWPWHLDRMKRFWRSILHNSGEYSGTPMTAHLAIDGLDRSHFAHWLNLFYETLREVEGDPAATQEGGGRARMIAESLLNGIVLRRDGLSGKRAGADLPAV